VSDHQPHEAGSPRSRREIREERERELSAARERKAAAQKRALDETLRTVRAQSASSSASAAGHTPRAVPAATSPNGPTRRVPLPAISPVQESVIFNQEDVPEGKLEREEPPPRQSGRGASSGQHDASDQIHGSGQSDSSDPHRYEQGAPSAATPFDRVVTPFDQVVSPDEAGNDAEQAIEDSSGFPLDEDIEEHPQYQDDLDEQHDDFDDHHYEGTRIHHDDDGTPLLISSSSYGRGYQTVSAVEGGATAAVLQKRRSKRRRRNLTLSVAFGLFAILLVGFVVVIQSLLGGDGPQDFETQAGDTVAFTVEEGDGPALVRNRLLEAGIIASPEAFDSAYESLDGTRELHPGDFEMREQMPAADALTVLFDEDEAVNYIEIRAGMRIEAAMSQIASATGIPESDLNQAAADPTAFGLPEQAETLEGYLASGEYRPEIESEPEAVLQQMVDKTFERLEAAGVTEEDEQWETIIIASLLTAEGLPGDYERIAGIIENRLDPSNDETDGLLQIDAAVIYGLGTQSVQFTDAERQDPDNPYNTYVNPGLPPGPIAAPNEETISAAGNPEPSDDYYWITTNLETGETKFSETYEQHLEYVDEFNAYCAENAEICEGEPAQDNQGNEENQG